MQHHIRHQLVVYSVLLVLIIAGFSTLYSLQPQEKAGAATQTLRDARIVPLEPEPDGDQKTAFTEIPSSETVITTTYIHAGTMLASIRSDSAETEYYITDHLGSSRKVLEQGIIEQENSYFAFGETASLGESPNAYKFTGKEKDSTGFYYYGARYYQPETGRFLQADAVRGTKGDPASLNRFTYGHNNPLLFVDPIGNDDLLYNEETMPADATATGIEADIKRQQQEDAEEDFQKAREFMAGYVGYLVSTGDEDDKLLAEDIAAAWGIPMEKGLETGLAALDPTDIALAIYGGYQIATAARTGTTVVGVSSTKQLDDIGSAVRNYMDAAGLEGKPTVIGSSVRGATNPADLDITVMVSDQQFANALARARVLVNGRNAQTLETAAGNGYIPANMAKQLAPYETQAYKKAKEVAEQVVQRRVSISVTQESSYSGEAVAITH